LSDFHTSHHHPRYKLMMGGHMNTADVVLRRFMDERESEDQRQQAFVSPATDDSASRRMQVGSQTMLRHQLRPISLRKAMYDWYATPACIHDPMRKLVCKDIHNLVQQRLGAFQMKDQETPSQCIQSVQTLSKQCERLKIKGLTESDLVTALPSGRDGRTEAVVVAALRGDQSIPTDSFPVPKDSELDPSFHVGSNRGAPELNRRHSKVKQREGPAPSHSANTATRNFSNMECFKCKGNHPIKDCPTATREENQLSFTEWKNQNPTQRHSGSDYDVLVEAKARTAEGRVGKTKAANIQPILQREAKTQHREILHPGSRAEEKAATCCAGAG
jgi:hypothetical protein